LFLCIVIFFGKKMFRVKKYALYACLLLVMVAGAIAAQQDGSSKKNLENEKKRLAKEIEQSSKLLDEISQKKKNSLSELSVLSKQLKDREHLIQNINQQLNNTNAEILVLERSLAEIDSGTVQLRNNYADMVRFAYKVHKTHSFLAFLLSAESFNDAYRRLQYIRRLNDYRQQRVNEMIKVSEEKKAKVAELNDSRLKSASLLQDHQQESEQLLLSKKRQDNLVKELGNEESDLRKKIKEKEKAVKRLDDQIRDIIRRELAATENRKSSGSAAGAAPDIAVERLSADFNKNQGKLPWPVQQGYIAGTFGRNMHPLVKNVYTTNNGIDIATQPNSEVRAIFSGTVSNILHSPGFQTAVILKHGQYFTVYTNLKEVFVNKGDEVKAKQSIGVVFTNEDNETELHLEIWKGTNKLNPQKWIAAQ